MPVVDAIPFGLRDIKITPYTDAQGTALASVSYDLPYVQTMTFTETEDFTEMRGDDALITTRGGGAMVDWSIEAGGMSLVIWSLFSGAALVYSGLAPNRIERLRKRGTDVRPWVRIDGRIMSDTAGDIWARIYRAKCNGDIGGDFGDQDFFTSGFSGVGYPLLDDTNDLVWELIRHETATPLTLTPEPNPLSAPQNLTAGTITATGATLTWTAVPDADAYRVQTSNDAGVTWTDVAGDPTTATKTLTGLTTATAYRARVASIKADVVSSYTDPVLFTTS